MIEDAIDYAGGKMPSTMSIWAGDDGGFLGRQFGQLHRRSFLLAKSFLATEYSTIDSGEGTRF
jgi:hypothetical protein